MPEGLLTTVPVPLPVFETVTVPLPPPPPPLQVPITVTAPESISAQSCEADWPAHAPPHDCSPGPAWTITGTSAPNEYVQLTFAPAHVCPCSPGATNESEPLPTVCSVSCVTVVRAAAVAARTSPATAAAAAIKTR